MAIAAFAPGRGRLVATAALACAAAWLAWFAVYQVDDAYIVYRYAANLARGAGFVYNDGERVEGVTCFLWTALLAPFAAAGLPLPRVAPSLTALCGLLILGLLPGVAVRLRGPGADRPAPGAERPAAPGPWDVAPAVLLAAHPAFAYWSVGALETVPFALLLLLALRAHLDETRSARPGCRSALWMGLATLVRPEAPLLSLALAADRALPRTPPGPTQEPLPGTRSARARLRETVVWCAVVAAFYVPFLAFRRLYFRAWLPNTYFAKTGDGLIHQIDEGWRYTLRFLAQMGPGFGSATPVAAGVGVLILLVCLAWALPRPGLRPAGLLIAALTAAVVLEGGDWMVLHRFWVPGLVLLLPILADLGRAAAGLDRRAAPAVVAGGGILLAAYVAYGVRARNGENGLATNAAGYRHAHFAVGEFLKERASPGDTVALMDIGIIGYVSGLRVFDISGLTEPSVARSPGGFLRKDYPADLVLARKPRFMVLVDGFTIDARIAGHPDFRRDYEIVFERNHRFNWTPPQSYTLHVFQRRAGPPGPAATPVDR